LLSFEELKERVPITDVAHWLGIKLDANHRGPCPFCEDRRSFTLTPEKRLFGCFKCQKRGSILDLVMHSREIGVRDAAKLIHDHFVGGEEQSPRQHRADPAPPSRQARATPARTTRDTGDLREVQTALERVKARLVFDHEILGLMGFPEVVWRSLGIGYDPRSKRIMYPLYKDGEWVGYGGLATSEDQSPLMMFHKNLVTICAAQERIEEPKEAPNAGRFLRVVK
jgi:hypothetical protein